MLDKRAFGRSRLDCSWRLGRQLLTAALICGLAPWSLAAEGPVGQARVYKKVGDRELRLFVVHHDGWQPTDQRPALVLFHGGGWTGGSPMQFNDQVTYLARRGMVCFQVEYRLVKDVPGPPLNCVHDAKSAMRWVRSHAGELGIDPKRIAAGGGSAGGHLAAFVGMVEGLDDPHRPRHPRIPRRNGRRQCRDETDFSQSVSLRWTYAWRRPYNTLRQIRGISIYPEDGV